MFDVQAGIYLSQQLFGRYISFAMSKSYDAESFVHYRLRMAQNQSTSIMQQHQIQQQVKNSSASKNRQSRTPVLAAIATASQASVQRPMLSSVVDVLSHQLVVREVCNRQ